MNADNETVVHVTPDASWLPLHGRAEVVRSGSPPHPMCVVRLLLRDADRVFCVYRDDKGGFDLPMLVTGDGDPHGVAAIADLAAQITGRRSRLAFVGAVRNVVEVPSDGYGWPTPLAHFGVWASEHAPIVEGTWLSFRDPSPLRERHWFPLLSNSGFLVRRMDKGKD